MEKESRDYYEMSLEEIRESKGFSRRQLSQLLAGKVSEDTLYSIEKRKQRPRVDTAMAICQVLDISLKEFCNSIGLDVSGIPGDTDWQPLKKRGDD